MAAPASLVEELRGVVGPAHVVTDPDLVAGYVRDWTGRFVGHTDLVVRPGTTEEVAGVVARCRRAGRPVLPQGGNTGLVGGSVPLAGEVVLSLSRLDGLGPVDDVADQVTVGAGATLAAVQRHVADAGLAVGVDLGARESATIGGMVATNAGGVHVVRHGAMRAQVVGAEAVLADGRTLRHLHGLTKDNTGYDLSGLLCGSEGTLAVVTRVRLRLVPRPRHRVTALLGFPSVAHAVEAVTPLRAEVPSLEAVELVLDDGVALVRRHLDLPPPLPTPWPAYLLVEAAGPADPTDELAAGVAAADAGDAAVAGTAARAAALWRYREAHTEAVNAVGPPVKLDVTLPMRQLAGFVPAVRDAVRGVAAGADTYLFGHAADGNLHVNVVGAAQEEAAVEEAVLGLVAGLGGSISAEHGIGTAKRRFLHLNRSPEELEVFRAIKAAFDPDRVLHPNAVLPAELDPEEVGELSPPTPRGPGAPASAPPGGRS